MTQSQTAPSASAKPVKLAFLSTAHIHAESWVKETVAANDGRMVHAVWDDVADRGKRHADLAKAPYTNDLKALVADPNVDAFVIAAENTRHLPLLRLALATGKPVLCEKPLATTTAEVREIAALVDQHGSILVNGYVWPFDGDHQAIARLLHNNAVGKITHVKFRNAHGGAWWRWFDRPALAWFHNIELAGGGGLLDEGTHGVHLLRLLFGRIKSVWATTRNLSGQYPSADDFGYMHLQFENGIFGTVEGSWVQTAGILKGLEVVGSLGAIYKSKSGYVCEKANQAPVPVISCADTPAGLDRLVAAIRNDTGAVDLRADFTAAIDSVIIMDAATRSAATGNWVALEDM
jgi:predicted dehydrogenase